MHSALAFAFVLVAMLTALAIVCWPRATLHAGWARAATTALLAAAYLITLAAIATAVIH